MSNPVRYVIDGREQFIPFREALELFEAEKEELTHLWEEEAAAFRRYGSMVNEFRKALHAKHVTACILESSGDIVEVPIALWARDDVGRVFRVGVAKFVSSASYEVYTHEGLVIIPEMTLVPYLERSLSSDPSTVRDGTGEPVPVQVPVVAAEEEAKRGRVGRPTVHDWERCWLQICIIAYVDGLPDVQADLVRRLADWFSAEFDRVPAESEIKKRVSEVYRAYRMADNS
jgi:hypothetical protein